MSQSPRVTGPELVAALGDGRFQVVRIRVAIASFITKTPDNCGTRQQMHLDYVFMTLVEYVLGARGNSRALTNAKHPWISSPKFASPPAP
jgi:hypothetical protein